MNNRAMKEALSEVTRELGVRRRCYSRWVSDGKLSEIDAEDRLARLEAAREIIEIAIHTAEMVSDTAGSAFAAGVRTALAVRVTGFAGVAQARYDAGLPVVEPGLVPSTGDTTDP